MQNPEIVEKRLDGMTSYRLHLAICPVCGSAVEFLAATWYDHERGQHGWTVADSPPEEEHIGPGADKETMPGKRGGELMGFCEHGHEIHLAMSVGMRLR